MSAFTAEQCESLIRAVDAGMAAADDLFTQLAQQTADTQGVTRASYGEGEQIAHALVAETARQQGLEVASDLAGNLYMTLPGQNRSAAALITGSHLDSVPCGGNYDGAAGVVAGLVALDALKRTGITPPRDLTVMAVWSEECGSWFVGRHGGHLGSRAALGLMAAEELDTAIHLGSGLTLGEQMAACGLDPDRLRAAPPHLSRATVAGYLELHIEQGPVLESVAQPVGIVTGIRGNTRARDACCIGEYTHSGAVPQSHRHDAVLATAELLMGLETEAHKVLADGGDIVFAAGKLFTDPALHSLSKVPGDVRFTLDIRSLDRPTIKKFSDLACALAEDIAARRGVRFDLGDFPVSTPTLMDDAHRRHLWDGCAALDTPAIDIASGGGHDAQEFDRSGIPASMIFVRNANGSHNADEAMALDDFAAGTKLLAWALATLP
jgi:N-carbamoyl-L-amino-acid hydrolase